MHRKISKKCINIRSLVVIGILIDTKLFKHLWKLFWICRIYLFMLCERFCNFISNAVKRDYHDYIGEMNLQMDEITGYLLRTDRGI